ncbi:MAG TPA: hypothetical protein VG537_03840 [Candidatus Kapabacteria bacterium]|nr:hypothetical protein [Candidatus Kapabacteria bacterium]
MKTLALILLALAMSYTSPRAQVGVITRSRNGRVTSTQIQVAPGTRLNRRTTTIYTTPQVYSSQPVYTSQQMYSQRHRRFMYRTEPLVSPYIYTAPNAGIANARAHGGRAHAYGLERRERFARTYRER